MTLGLKNQKKEGAVDSGGILSTSKRRGVNLTPQASGSAGVQQY